MEQATITKIGQPFQLELSLPANRFLNNWGLCSNLANYISKYVGYQFKEQERAENLVSTITNEIFEAIISLIPEETDLSLALTQSEQGLCFKINHKVQTTSLPAYLDFLKKMSKPVSDQEYFTMYISEHPEEPRFNQLGILMLSHDFNVQFPKVEAVEDNHIFFELSIMNEDL